MKNLLIFALGIAAGTFGYRYFTHRASTPPPTPPSTREVEAVAPPQTKAAEPTPLKEKVARVAQDVSERSREIARETQTAVGDKLRDWKLTPDDLREDLKRGGAIVRTKARKAGAELSDARIVAMVKAKYVLDRELSARGLNVDVKAGEVTLRGEVASEALIGHAIALALDTDGVVSVVSRLTVAAR